MRNLVVLSLRFGAGLHYDHWREVYESNATPAAAVSLLWTRDWTRGARLCAI